MGEFIHGDCMEYLKEYKNNHFDLSIVDPPYGIGILVVPRNRTSMNYLEYLKIK